MRCVPGLLRHKNKRLGRPLSADEIDDLTQDVLTVVWRKLEVFAGHSTLEMWVAQICTLELLAYLRRRRRGMSLIDDARIAWREPTTPPDQSSVEFADLYVLLEQLAPEEEAVVRLKHFGHLKFEEIADRLGISVNTVKTRYYRGLTRMRDSLVRQDAEAGA